jgi:hypothetical protein
MNKLLFLCVSLAILLFNIIFTNLAPIIKKKVGHNWSYYACGLYSDRYNYAKKEAEGFSSELKDLYLNPIKKEKTRCDRRKAMNGLEFVVSNLNFIFGFVCTFAGFLFYFKIGNLGNDGKYIGLIGLGCGAVGFVLTLVYVIESGLAFTDVTGELRTFNILTGITFNGFYDCPSSYEAKIDSDGAYLKWNGSKKKYECIFYKEDKEDSVFLKYSDYGNKYLNYKKELHFDDNKKNYYQKCKHDIPISKLYYYCSLLSKSSNDEISTYDSYISSLINNKKSFSDNDHHTIECDKLYDIYNPTINQQKIIHDYWLTSLIFSCFIMVLYIVLALFGFLLFREPGGSGTPVPNK